jgi:mannose/cellobiose epimerase-like protein (N-acyl-D-glucosamine 2-epimerase family)
VRRGMTSQVREDQERSAHVRTWLTQQALPYWRSAGLDPQGGFAERLTLDGTRDIVPKRVFVQMRQICVYAQAEVLGFSPGGLNLASRAFNDVMTRAQLPGGGFAYSLTPDGDIADPTRDAYTHAFLLKAASLLYRGSGKTSVLSQMDVIASAIERLRHPGGNGYAESDKPDVLRRQNSHMHLLGAFLAAHAATGNTAYLRLAGEIYVLFREFFFDGGKNILREYYTQNLLPTSDVHSDIVEGGHHYQWVWLLGEFAKASGGALPPQAQLLYRFAANHAHEKATGLIYSENRADGSVRDAGKRAWPLAESIRAAIALAEDAGTPLDPQADQCVDNLFRYFLDRPRPGTWLDTLTPDNRPAVRTCAASNFYHVFIAFAEYVRFSEKHRNRAQVTT